MPQGCRSDQGGPDYMSLRLTLSTKIALSGKPRQGRTRCGLYRQRRQVGVRGLLGGQTNQIQPLLLPHPGSDRSGSCPDSCGKRKCRILPVGKLTTNHPPARAAAGGMRHGAEYQEAEPATHRPGTKMMVPPGRPECPGVCRGVISGPAGAPSSSVTTLPVRPERGVEGHIGAPDVTKPRARHRRRRACARSGWR